MPKKDAAPPASPRMTAVDFINNYNADVEGFNVELSMQVTEEADGNVVVAGISVDMGRSDFPAFIPSDVLRALADEADAMVKKAVEDSNRRG